MIIFETIAHDQIGTCRRHEGWTETTYGVKNWDGLPKNAQIYLKRIEQLVGTSIDLVSTGPDREETVVVRHPFRN